MGNLDPQKALNPLKWGKENNWSTSSDTPTIGVPEAQGTPWEQMTEQQRGQFFKDQEAQNAARNQLPSYSYGSAFDSNTGDLQGMYKATETYNPTQFYSNIDELKNRGKTSQTNLDNRLSGIQLNKDALNELRKRSMATGPSAWAELATQQQQLGEATNRDRAAAQSQSSNEAAKSDLAASGGLSAGARERLARNSQRDLSSTRQDVAREGQGQRLGISAQDDANKTDILKALPGMEVQALNPDFQKAQMQTSLETSNNDAWRQLAESEASRHQNLDETARQHEIDAQRFNISNRFNENTLRNAANLSNYQMQMKDYGAKQQQEAMKRDEGKGGVKGGGKN